MSTSDLPTTHIEALKRIHIADALPESSIGADLADDLIARGLAERFVRSWRADGVVKIRTMTRCTSEGRDAVAGLVEFDEVAL